MILEGKQFCAYIVIPLHPEGDPATAPIQEILAWQVCFLVFKINIIMMSSQRRTMAMMYRRVGQALRQAGSSAHPQDHLLFLTPLAREDEDEIPDCLKEENLAPGSNAEKLRNSRRLMIYVHSKLMVVDDSAAIIGSDLGFRLLKMRVPNFFHISHFNTSFNSW